jgi:hypothetical protein
MMHTWHPCKKSTAHHPSTLRTLHYAAFVRLSLSLYTVLEIILDYDYPLVRP